MKVICNRESLLSAFNAVSGVVPSRSPKPIIQNVKITATEDGTTLMATDLEVGIRHRVLGVQVDTAGSAILPTEKFGQILRSSGDQEITIELRVDGLVVTGDRSQFTLMNEDPDTFPEVPDFNADRYHVLPALHLRKLIRRTIFATDIESARYALGGTLVELKNDSVAMVATDGRRLARMITAAETENNPILDKGSLVIPVKALKLIERNLTDEGLLVHLAFSGGTAVLVRTDNATIYSRLVEGRFPRYQDVFPSVVNVAIPLPAGLLRRTVEQASIVTSEESRGVDFTFGGNMLKMSSQSSDVGSSHVEMPIEYEGDPLTLAIDPRYLTDALKTIDDEQVIIAELIDGKSAVVFRAGEEYVYVVMPLTRER